MNILRNARLDQHNTLALSAAASAMVCAADEPAIVAALQWARSVGLPVIPLGQGSNIVLAGDVEALVLQIQTRGIEEISRTDQAVTLKVAAGEPWHDFVQWTLQHHLYGLENLALIPGTVGAAPIQNIGAYGVELCEFVQRVHALEIDGANPVSFTRAQCQFAYRDSVFKQALNNKVVITAVELVLPLEAAVNTRYPALAAALGESSQSATPQQVFDAVVALRRNKLPDPLHEPNAGSFFKNPVISQAAYEAVARIAPIPAYPQPDGAVKVPAAALIEHCGWKGRRRGDQGVHPQHALVLVNYGNGSGRQLLALAQDIQADVLAVFAIALEIEPRVMGKKL